MKKIMITLLLALFCSTTFAFENLQQDTTKKRQDTSRRQPMKSKKKYPGKKPIKKDTTKRKTGDTTKWVQPVM